MSVVNSRASLIDYCKKRLGWPVIQINVDDEQVSDRIDDALQYFQDYHYDASQLFFISHLVSQQDINNKYIDISQLSGTGYTMAGSNTVNGASTYFGTEVSVGQSLKVGAETHNVASVIDANHITMDANFTTTQNSVVMTNMDDSNSILSVVKLYPLSATSASVNMFDLRYQLRLHDLYDFTSTSYVNFVLTQQHLRTLDMLFTGEIPIRFNRHQNRLYIDAGWGTQIQVGEYIMCECYKVVNPDSFTTVWNDRFLKKYATALIKRQWGANLSKYGGVQLLGGVQLNGTALMEQANEEIDKLEAEMQSHFELPVSMFIG